MIWIKFLLLSITTLFLTSCDVIKTEPLKGTLERSGKPIITTIYFYNSVEEVQDKFREVHNLSKNHRTNVEGFSRWPEFRDSNGKPLSDDGQTLTCTIYTVRPTSIDDNATLTLGHELLHCIIGTYHKEPS